MLIGFKVKNFKSFRDLQYFSLIAGKVRSNESQYIEKNNKKILRFSEIFGANGSGKSNLIFAMDFIHDLLNYGTNLIIDNLYFRGEQILSDESSYFEYELSINDRLYSYGFEILIKEKKIISEWLIDLTNRKRVIYDRNVINGTYDSIKNSKNKSFINCLEEMKNNTTMLFLSEIIRRSTVFNIKEDIIEEIYSIFKFFRNDFIIIRPHTHKIFGIDFLNNQKEKIDILNKLDINIEKLIEEPEDLKNIRNLMPDNIFSNLMNDINNMKKDNKKRMTLRIGNNVYVIDTNSGGEPIVKSLHFKHRNCKDKFGTYEESDGTLRIFELLDVIFSKGKVFVIDELDNSMHPILVKGFLSKFLNTDSDTQLIVTTHESQAMDFDIVRRDEIWFAEKMSDCSSKLYSLEEFKDIARFDRKIDKAYLEGRFGAIANIHFDE